MTGSDKRIIRQWVREDRDPSLWPVRGQFRVFMIECPRCRSKFSPSAKAAHERRCV